MLAALLACASPPPPASEAPAPSPRAAPVEVARKALSVALNWYPEPEFGGYYQALLDGTYAAQGLDVTLIPGGPGTPVLEMLQAASADVAVSGADDLLARRDKGLDAVAVFAGFQHSPVGLMAHAGGPATFDAVKGPVAIEAGSPFQRFLWAKYAWDGKVAMVPTTGSVGPFAADPTLVMQAYVTSEPCVAEGQGLKVNFLPGKDAGWDPYASLAVVREADAQAPWVKGFVDASHAGWVSYLADPAKANAEIARLNPALPLALMSCVTERQRPFVKGEDGVGAMTAARWAEIAAAVGAGDPAGAWQ